MLIWGRRCSTQLIADVAVRKRHQRLDESRIIFTCTSFKSCFHKSFVMQYIPLTLKAIQFAQHTLVRLLYIHAFHAWMKCVRYRQKKNFADSSIVRVKNINIMISSCRWWWFLTATSAIQNEVQKMCFRLNLLKYTIIRSLHYPIDSVHPMVIWKFFGCIK